MAYYTASKGSGGLGGVHGGLSEDHGSLGNCGLAKQQAGLAKAMVIASRDSPEKQQLSKAERRRRRFGEGELRQLRSPGGGRNNNSEAGRRVRGATQQPGGSEPVKAVR